MMNKDQRYYAKLHKRANPNYPQAVYFDTKKNRYVRLYRSSNSKYYKQQSNRRIRKYQGDISNGNHCHRLYNFWWALY